MTANVCAPFNHRMLAGNTALVTGGSAGLGKSFARTLAAAGANVVVMARRAEMLTEVVDEIIADGGRAGAVSFDLTRVEEIPTALDRAEEIFGPISILINNAGVVETQSALDLDLESIDQMIAINLKTPYVLSRELARRLIARKMSGRIVNICSMVAFSYTGQVPCSFYATIKAGIVRMTEVLSVEWAKHMINVNAIAPGFIMTDMNRDLMAEQGEAIAKTKSRSRLGEAHHLTSTLLYLVADESEFVTGTCIRADDGQGR